MQIGFVGLGRMGGNMVARIRRDSDDDVVAFDFDPQAVARAEKTNQGSVIRLWLCELAARAFEADGNDLAGLEGWVEDSGEGRWTLQDAIDHGVPTPALSAALNSRFYSRAQGDYSARVLAALRNQFGGHAVKTSGSP